MHDYKTYTREQAVREFSAYFAASFPGAPGPDCNRARIFERLGSSKDEYLEENPTTRGPQISDDIEKLTEDLRKRVDGHNRMIKGMRGMGSACVHFIKDNDIIHLPETIQIAENPTFNKVFIELKPDQEDDSKNETHPLLVRADVISLIPMKMSNVSCKNGGHRDPTDIDSKDTELTYTFEVVTKLETELLPETTQTAIAREIPKLTVSFPLCALDTTGTIPSLSYEYHTKFPRSGIRIFTTQEAVETHLQALGKRLTADLRTRFEEDNRSLSDHMAVTQKALGLD